MLCKLSKLIVIVVVSNHAIYGLVRVMMRTMDICWFGRHFLTRVLELRIMRWVCPREAITCNYQRSYYILPNSQHFQNLPDTWNNPLAICLISDRELWLDDLVVVPGDRQLVAGSVNCQIPFKPLLLDTIKLPVTLGTLVGFLGICLTWENLARNVLLIHFMFCQSLFSI